MSGRQLLCLDIDGVMNPEYFYVREQWRGEHPDVWAMEPTCCAILASVFDRLPDLRVIISSSWRVGRTVKELRGIFQSNELDGSRIIARTGPEIDTFRGGRGQEIGDWFAENGQPGDRVVIVDDECDHMGRFYHHCIRINPRNGLTCDDADEIVRRFTFTSEVSPP